MGAVFVLAVFVLAGFVLAVFVLAVFVLRISVLAVFCSHNTLFVGYLFFAPEPRELIVGNFVFDPPRGTRAMVIIVVIVVIRFFSKIKTWSYNRLLIYVFFKNENKTKNKKKQKNKITGKKLFFFNYY